MRILIANHIDPAIRDRGDLRAWTQRVFWFARDGDVVVLCDEPDNGFLTYATGHTDTDAATLRIVVAPPGRYGGRLLDPESLTSPELLGAVRDVIEEGGPGGVEEVFALWPSAAVARFAEALGVADRFPGAGFFAQGGGELCNNKAAFRALAASAGVAISAGSVVRSSHEAIEATQELLADRGAVVVKQAHNGAGVGNQLLVANPSLDLDRVGARHLHPLDDSGREAIEAYWRQRWDWASAEGRFPAVIEEFTPHTSSLYSEHYAAETGTRPTEMGTLLYRGRRLSHQIVPLRDVNAEVRAQLAEGGQRLAQMWHAVGYRGHLSADAVLTPDERVVFTEVNAQVSGSLHIYEAIAHGIVGVDAEPQRLVVEYHVPPTWAVADFATFLTALNDLGCAYDPASRTGVIVSMPAIPLQPGRAQFLFCLAYATDSDRRAVLDALDLRFATTPVGAYSASDHVGIPPTREEHDDQPTA